MGGKIDCYLDTASFFSYVAFVDLSHNLDLLAKHGVEVEFHPILIAGVNNLSGNKPPWMLKAKATYLSKDSPRAAARVGLTGLAFPKDFMSMALTISPQRALLYIKANFPTATFLSAMHSLNHAFWIPPHVNLTVDDNLRRVLSEATEAPEGGAKLFSEQDVDRIMSGREEMKDALKQGTERAVELGAFGLPWLVATNDKGETDPYFGSDRFNHLYEFLGIPYNDVKVLEPRL